jgi:hypothetical protein
MLYICSQFLYFCVYFIGDSKPTRKVYEDDVLCFLYDYLPVVSDHTDENKAYLLFAVPGAGKTFSVGQAILSLNLPCHREKFVDVHTFIEQLKDLAKHSSASTFDGAKEVFKDACAQFFQSIWSVNKIRAPDDRKTFVLHFDESQLLMGNHLVSRHDSDVSKNLYDYVMPAFCDAANLLLKEHKWLKIVFTGTNFFTPLVLNVGSQLKTHSIKLLGRFPLWWVIEHLNESFDLGAMNGDELKKVVEPLCANRRATNYLVRELQFSLHLNSPPSSGAFVYAAILRAVEAAYAGWRNPILQALGDNRSAVLAQVFSLLTYPASLDESVKFLTVDEIGNVDWIAVEVVRVLRSRLSDDVKSYLLAGGLNVWLDGDYVLVEQPIGCVRKLWSELLSTHFTANTNVEQVKAFFTVAYSNESVKGHAFERLLACELTLCNSKLHSLISKKTKTDFHPDALAMSQPFVYESKIHQADWTSTDLQHRVMCVKEEGSSGRLVDVGFPLLTVDGGDMWKMLVELKYGYPQADLWRLCWTFFDKMQAAAVSSASKAVAIFLSSVTFLNHAPRQANVKAGLSAFDSRAKVLALMNQRPKQFIILDVSELTKYTVLPFHKIMEHISCQTSPLSDTSVVVNGATTAFASMYVSGSPTPQSLLPRTTSSSSSSSSSRCSSSSAAPQ